MRLYQFILVISKFAITAIAPFNKKIATWQKGQKEIFKSLQNSPIEGKVLWVHAASLGEFEQGRPIIEKWKQTHPEHKIVLSFFSPSGYQVQKNYPHADIVCYLPLDTRKNAMRFINAIQPTIAIFIKYEYWFNYLSILKKRNTPVYMASAIFRPKQHFFQWYGFWFRKQLKNINHFFIQNQTSATLLAKTGLTNYTLTGDTRFDRVLEIAQQAKSFPLIEAFALNRQVIIAGSSWEADEKILLNYYNNLGKENKPKLIIAPHQVNDEHIQQICQQLNAPYKLYSKLSPSSPIEEDILIIDCIGTLSQLYQYGDIAFIGGAFGKGLHNILEAATFGLPVIFGPKYERFQEAVDLVKQKGAFSIKNQEEFNTICSSLLKDKPYYSSASKACKNYIYSAKGASEKILYYIQNHLNN